MRVPLCSTHWMALNWGMILRSETLGTFAAVNFVDLDFVPSGNLA